jgi:hypothetical protein
MWARMSATALNTLRADGIVEYSIEQVVVTNEDVQQELAQEMLDELGKRRTQ